MVVTPFAVTLTFLVVRFAEFEMVNLVVICVPAAFTVKAPTVIPFPPTFTDVVPVKLVPLSITLTVVP